MSAGHCHHCNRIFINVSTKKFLRLCVYAFMALIFEKSFPSSFHLFVPTFHFAEFRRFAPQSLRPYV
jgi:hypothetical protein